MRGWMLLLLTLAALAALYSAVTWFLLLRPNWTAGKADRWTELLQTSPPERINLLRRSAMDTETAPDVQTTDSNKPWETIDERTARDDERQGQDPVLFWTKAIVARCDARPQTRADSSTVKFDPDLYLAAL